MSATTIIASLLGIVAYLAIAYVASRRALIRRATDSARRAFMSSTITYGRVSVIRARVVLYARRGARCSTPMVWTLDGGLTGVTDARLSLDAQRNLRTRPMTAETPEEIQTCYERVLASLAPADAQLIGTIVSGAEVNHCALYTALAFGLGVLLGVML